MDARHVARMLRAEGVHCVAHNNGRLTARKTLARDARHGEGTRLLERVTRFPGAEVILAKDRPAADPYFHHVEVIFRLGPAPESVMVGGGEDRRAA